jgi:hypothetical protein
MGPTEEDKTLIDVLGMEYAALRADIVHRSAARFSMLSVGLGIFALFASLAQISDKLSTLAAWIILCAYLVILSVSWLNAGRSIGNLSNRIVEIEREINTLMAPHSPLQWEAAEQHRRGILNRLVMGQPIE